MKALRTWCAVAALACTSGASLAQVLAATDFAPNGQGAGTFSSVANCVVTPEGVCGIYAGTTATFTFDVTSALGSDQYALVTFAYTFGTAPSGAPLTAPFTTSLFFDPAGANTQIGASVPLSPTTSVLTPDVPSSGDQFSYHFGILPTGTGTYELQISNAGPRNIRVADVTVTAVPEPSAYAMALASLGVLGYAAARRRRDRA